MSKLYTKEMFLIAAEKCEVSMIDARHIMQYIDEYVTPIELPSDEKIEMAAPYVPRDAHDYYIGCRDGLIEGAKWMRDKIKGGNNEN
jgi:hypothetical protein